MAALKNLGEKSAAWLVEVGVDSPERLAEIGAVEAYARVKAVRPRVSLVMLWALHGALEDVHFASVPPEVKEMLKLLLAERDQPPARSGQESDRHASLPVTKP